jgi:ABC-2 type transport system ATP-binding protein
MADAVAFENVVKTYRSFSNGSLHAVQGITFAIPQGSCFALLGPNRAGKTTLIKMLLSLCAPTSGKVNRLGEVVAKKSTLARVGYMHENHAFPRYHTAQDVLSFYGGLSGVSAEHLPEKVDSLLNKVGLKDRTREPIHRFSKGMVQRLGLAQAIINDPDLLVLDEPTEGLDLMGRKLLREVVRSMKSAGKTVLMVSHVLPEIEELCDQSAVIVGGKLCFQGSIGELKADRTLEQSLQSIYEQGVAA